MYIYLDTAQVAEFAKEAAIDSTADGLVAKWNEKKHVLCLSLQHLQEIALLADANSRRDRFLAIKKLKQLRFSDKGWPSIVQNEIMIQLIRDINSQEHKEIALPSFDTWKETKADILYRYIENNLRTLRRSRMINEAACVMQEHFASIKKVTKKYGIKNAVRLRDLGQDTKKMIQRTVEIMKSTEGYEKVPIILKSLAELEKAGSLEEYLGIESVPGVKKRDLSDLDSLSVLFKIGREAIASMKNMTGLTEDKLRQYLYRINIAKCPGFLLRMVLLRAIKSSDKTYTPSDWADINHVVYAPYVDLFYADKRTHHFLEKETREQTFKLPEALIENIRRVVTLEKVIIEN